MKCKRVTRSRGGIMSREQQKGMCPSMCGGVSSRGEGSAAWTHGNLLGHPGDTPESRPCQAEEGAQPGAQGGPGAGQGCHLQSTERVEGALPGTGTPQGCWWSLVPWPVAPGHQLLSKPLPLHRREHPEPWCSFVGAQQTSLLGSPGTPRCPRPHALPAGSTQAAGRDTTRLVPRH